LFVTLFKTPSDSVKPWSDTLKSHQEESFIQGAYENIPSPPQELMKKSDHKKEVLWLLWEFYFRKIGLERLKRCPQCKRWFVDRTRNKQKEHCSLHCTWQWWSWIKRKKEGHNLPNKESIRRKGPSKRRLQSQGKRY